MKKDITVPYCDTIKQIHEEIGKNCDEAQAMIDKLSVLEKETNDLWGKIKNHLVSSGQISFDELSTKEIEIKADEKIVLLKEYDKFKGLLEILNDLKNNETKEKQH